MAKQWPVTASWDATLFEALCIEGSFLTSITPNGWWDVGSPSDLIIVYFRNEAKVVLHNMQQR